MAQSDGKKMGQGTRHQGASVRKPGALAGFASVSGFFLGTLSLLLGLLLSPSLALAYSDSNGLDRFLLSPTSDGLVGMRSGKLLPHLRSESTFYMGYADRLLMGRGADGAEAVFVGNRVAGAVSTSLGLWGIGELDLVLPFVAHQQAWGNFRPLMDPTFRMDELASSGLSDLKLIPRVQLLDAARHHLDLALSLDISFPTGGAHDFLGDNRVLWRPSLAASMNLLPDLRVAVETGVLIRKREHLLGDVDAATEFDLGVGAGWRFGPENRPFELQGSLGGVFGMSNAGKQQHSEFRSAVSWEPLSGLQLLLGAGVGLVHSYGTPAWRAFSGIRYAFTIPTPARPEPLPEPVPEALPEPEEEPEEEPVVVEEDEPLPPPDELWLTVHFSDGSDQVDEEGRKTLRRVAAVLRDRPELTLFVDGHSDARGVLELNLGLSLRRARAVVRLLQLEGVDGKRLKARGHGPKRPVADNDTEEGRRQNRRVEFLLQPSAETSDSGPSVGDTSRAESESGADAEAKSDASAVGSGSGMPDSGKSDSGKSDGAKPDAANSDSPPSDALKSDLPKSGALKSDAPHSGAPTSDDAKKASESKSESDAASAESGQRKAEQKGVEASQGKARTLASSSSDSGASESGESRSRNTDSRKSDSKKAGSKKSDSSDSEPSTPASGQPETEGGTSAEAEPKGQREKGGE